MSYSFSNGVLILIEGNKKNGQEWFSGISNGKQTNLLKL